MKKKITFVLALALCANSLVGLNTTVNASATNENEVEITSTSEEDEPLTESVQEHYQKEKESVEEYNAYIRKMEYPNVISHYASSWTDMRYSTATKEDKTYLIDVGISSTTPSTYTLYSHTPDVTFDLSEDTGTLYYLNAEENGFVLDLSDGISEIADGSFKHESVGGILTGTGITSVQMNPTYNHTKVIGKEAFSGNSNLTSVGLGRHIEEIGSYAFADTGLTTLAVGTNAWNTTGTTFPYSLTTLGEGAFSNTKLTSMIINAPIINMEKEVFANNKSLTFIVYDCPVLGEGAFKNCTSLSTVNLGTNLTEIGANAFEGDTSLKELSLKSTTNLKTIEASAFKGTNIEEIYLPVSVESIDMSAFDNCVKFTTLTVNNPKTELIDVPQQSGLQIIYGYKNSTAEEYALKHNLKFIDIGESDNSCGENATWTFDNGILTIQGTGKIAYTPRWDRISQDVTEIRIAEGITEIGMDTSISNKGCFQDFKNVTKVSLPGTLKTIGTKAFLNVLNVKFFEIPSSVETIEDYAIGYGYNKEVVEYTEVERLTNMAMDTELLRLGSIQSTKEVTSWSSIVHNPESKQTIVALQGTVGSSYAKNNSINYINNAQTNYECGENATWTYDTETKTLTISGTGNVEYVYDWEKADFKNKVEKVIIEEGITGLTEGVFQDFVNLAKVEIPESLEVIEANAFVNTALDYLYIPDTTTTIGKAVDSIEVSGDIVDVGVAILTKKDSQAETYAQRHNLAIIYIGETAEEKYYGSCGTSTEWFYNATESKLTLKGSGEVVIAPWLFVMNNVEELPVQEIIIGNGITTIEAVGAFSNKDFQGVTKVDIPEGVILLGNKLFEGLENLEKVTLPTKSLTTIGDYTFNNCPKLAMLKIPFSVQKIGEKALGYIQTTENEAQVNKDFVVYGYSDTIAEEYSGKNNLRFIDIGKYSYILGDINNDTKVNILDFILLKSYLFGNCTLDVRSELSADMNKDNEINAIDVVLLKKTILNYI